MNKVIRAYALGVLSVLFLFSSSFAQEDLTITTYYPSPNGSYQDLTVNHYLNMTGNALNNIAGISTVDNGIRFLGMANDAAVVDFHGWAADRSELRLMISDNTNDRVYIGGGGMSAGIPNGIYVYGSGDAVFNRNIYMQIPAEVTADPLNGWAWYTTGTISRYSSKCHAPC